MPLTEKQTLIQACMVKERELLTTKKKLRATMLGEVDVLDSKYALDRKNIESTYANLVAQINAEIRLLIESEEA